jgi:hypothetical protein
VKIFSPSARSWNDAPRSVTTGISATTCESGTSIAGEICAPSFWRSCIVSSPTGTDVVSTTKAPSAPTTMPSLQAEPVGPNCTVDPAVPTPS